MKYEVQHSVLSSPTRTFKQDETVTAADLTEHGFDVAFLLRNGAVSPLKGTESDGPPAPAVAPAPLPPVTFGPPAPSAVPAKDVEEEKDVEKDASHAPHPHAKAKHK